MITCPECGWEGETSEVEDNDYYCPDCDTELDIDDLLNYGD